jgi:hypothetical protein
MKPCFSLLIAVAMWLGASVSHAAADPDRTVREVQFAKGSTTAVLKGKISGRNYIDYRLRAGAGQRMKVGMQGSNLANYFNVLPPDSGNSGMYNSSISGNNFEVLLPTDGSYTVRVYLMRSAARRNESSNFTLSIAIEGKPLLPVSSKVDAVIPGTNYHAQTTVKCEPPYTKTRECEALVIRRGFDGTATVELRWDKDSKRRILFVKGKPESADVSQEFKYTRNDRGYVVVFNGDERFEIPEALIFGG